MQIIINPGTEPIDDASETDAIDNIKHFITDLGLDREVRWLREPREDERGRFGFLLYADWYVTLRATLIQMPGLPLEQVRWREGLDPWQYPRLYVNGSSWLWGFALGSATRELTGRDVEDD